MLRVINFTNLLARLKTISPLSLGGLCLGGHNGLWKGFQPLLPSFPVTGGLKRL